ncbi:MAG: hypothetical protein MK179_23305, partial [Pirellulaceae bacterium]|nr:hypothetical protein [Pirellulaceae bacterium]
PISHSEVVHSCCRRTLVATGLLLPQDLHRHRANMDNKSATTLLPETCHPYTVFPTDRAFRLTKHGDFTGYVGRKLYSRLA